MNRRGVLFMVVVCSVLIGSVELVAPGVATAAPAPSSAAAASALFPVGYAGTSRQSTQRPMTNTGSQQFTSRNWDGYITYTPTASIDFNTVQASWVQPTVTCEKASAWTVFWIGLDGWFNDTVEQGGSEAYCPRAHKAATYGLWWEMYPTNSIQTVLIINPGDHITASVTFVPGTQLFTIEVSDTTSGQSFTEQETCASGLVCERSSTDVITEDVGRFGANSFFPLAKYGTMTYAGAEVTDTTGDSGTISAPTWLNAAVTEKLRRTTYAKVTALVSGGSSFSAIWHHR
jgi:hypothetical protein